MTTEYYKHVVHWVLRASQGPEGKHRQQAASLWILDPDVLPTAEYVEMRARTVDFSLLETFGSVSPNREWMIAHTVPLPLYKEAE